MVGKLHLLLVLLVCLETNFGQDLSGCFGDDLFAFYSSVVLNFDSSDAFCAGIGSGGRLATIKSASEHEFIKTIVPNTFSSVWIGIRNFGSSAALSNFEFIDGSTDGLEFFRTAQGTYPWSASEPNMLNGLQFCVHIYPDRDWLFDDVACSDSYPFLCRIKDSCVTDHPSPLPSESPSESPTSFPTRQPTFSPSSSPSQSPSLSPTSLPTRQPTFSPVIVTAPSPECRIRSLGRSNPLTKN